MPNSPVVWILDTVLLFYDVTLVLRHQCYELKQAYMLQCTACIGLDACVRVGKRSFHGQMLKYNLLLCKKLVVVVRPPQSEFVPKSAWAALKCACQNEMYIAPYSQPYIEYINIFKPQSYYLEYSKLNIQNIVSIAGFSNI